MQHFIFYYIVCNTVACISSGWFMYPWCLYRVQLFRCVVSIQLQQVERVVVRHVVLKKYQLTYKLLALKRV